MSTSGHVDGQSPANGRADGRDESRKLVPPPGGTLKDFELVRQGAREDDVEILLYEPRFSRPGTPVERRIERTIAFMLLLAGAFATAFVVIYVIWPRFHGNRLADAAYTPLLGATLGMTLVLIGLAIATWAKKLFPAEVAVQQRHLGASPPASRAMTAATLRNMANELGLKRRPVLKFGLLGLLPVGAAAIVPLGALIENPHKHDQLVHTGFDPANNGGNPVPLVHEDNTPVYPEDLSIGGQITVFPGIPGGTTNKWADSPTLLIRLRTEDAGTLRSKLLKVNQDAMWNDYVAYSKICTHLGCPASLYQQQNNILLCPCHQSQFLITDNATPIFGPATNRLPMLPIGVDPDKGYLIAKSDFREPIGPGFWERP